jgi:hypothetical protein
MAAVWGATGLGHGPLTGWEIQSVTVSEDNKRGTAPDEIGNEAAAQVYDDTQQVTTNYKATVKTAPTIPASIGAEINGITTTQITVSTDSEDFATMTLTGHAHTDGDHGTCKSVAHGMTLDRGFGASDFGVTGGESVRSSELTITCEHSDVPGAEGDTAGGENYNPRVEISVRVLGDSPSLPGGFDRMTDALEGASEDFQYTTISGVKPLAFT